VLVGALRRDVVNASISPMASVSPSVPSSSIVGGSIGGVFSDWLKRVSLGVRVRVRVRVEACEFHGLLSAALDSSAVFVGVEEFRHPTIPKFAEHPFDIASLASLLRFPRPSCSSMQ
jgi:hypothetical protein